LDEKKYPAPVKADAVREIALENKKLRAENRIIQNYIQYYEVLFPWLVDYRDQNLEEILELTAVDRDSPKEDSVLRYMPQAEYNRYTTIERNQVALDRYLNSRKSSWQIGRDYERFIGYLYEQEGYKVKYFGIMEGLEDLGRDLICIRGGQIEIVQCKCWSTTKFIHEKHITQLFGTTMQYIIENNLLNAPKGHTLSPDWTKLVKMVLYTSTSLSKKAKEFAQALGVEYKENCALKPYPLIKCNITGSGEKIYHLPFDQQYDKIDMSRNKTLYLWKVAEAESLGYRRAYKWRG